MDEDLLRQVRERREAAFGWGESDIHERASNLLEGGGYPEDVPKLLALFCEQMRLSRESGALVDYVTGAIRAWIEGGETSLDRAFGLHRRGRPRSHETADRNEQMAIAVAWRRLTGETLENAAAQVADTFGADERNVKRAYSACKPMADSLAEARRKFRALRDDD